MSDFMGNPAFCICENKATDQLRGNHAADQHLCFRYRDSTTCNFQNPSFKHQANFCRCTALIVSDLVRNLKDRFSSDAAHIKLAQSIMRLSNDGVY